MINFVSSISGIEYTRTKPSCICRFQPPPITIIIIIIMKGVWNRPTAAANLGSPRMTSVRGLEGAEVGGDRVCIIRIRGRAMPSWTYPMSRLRCHHGRKAKMRIVTGFVALVSPAKVRNHFFPLVANNGLYFLCAKTNRNKTSTWLILHHIMDLIET